MNKYDIAAYIWPSYTGDEPRTRMFWPEGIGEWQSVKHAVKKFPGHSWPRKPLWGYVNEADPEVMESQIETAAEYGVNVFIYDWYWYDRRPFLENCLNDGYLQARNNDKVKFYLMWANHHVQNLWDIRLSDQTDNIIWNGSVDRREFEKICLRLIQKYFHHSSYYRINGKPVFCIYDLKNLIDGLGGIRETGEALQWFRTQTIRAGFPDLHLQLISYGENQVNLSGIDTVQERLSSELVKRLGVNSLTHYQFLHFVDIDRDYLNILEDVVPEWTRLDEYYAIPYFPHVSVGWDNNPRFKKFKPGIVRDNTPENFGKALRKAKEYVDQHPEQPPLITINSWNEWTETSYLEPDDLNGYGYLEEIRKVFSGAVVEEKAERIE